MTKKIFFLSLLFILFFKVAFAGETILFSRVSEDGYWQVWQMSPANGGAGAKGENQRQITFSAEDKRNPLWIEKKQKIAFRTSNGQLLASNLDGKNQEALLEKYGYISHMDFSPETNEILFVRFDPKLVDISDIWKSDWEGNNPVILTKDNQTKFYPSFSWDGKKIAFVKGEVDKQSHHVWVTDADGTNAKQLTFGDGDDALPSFSPDGKAIIFSSNKEGNFDLYRLDFLTGELKKLTRHPGLDTGARFSSDGKKIIFVSDRKEGQQIWIMSANGAQQRQLTFGPSEAIDPVWVSIKEEGQ